MSIAWLISFFNDLETFSSKYFLREGKFRSTVMDSTPTDFRAFRQTKIISASANFDSEPINSAPT